MHTQRGIIGDRGFSTALPHPQHWTQAVRWSKSRFGWWGGGFRGESSIAGFAQASRLARLQDFFGLSQHTLISPNRCSPMGSF